MPEYESIVWTDSPRWGLIAFVDQHLGSSKRAVVLCENWAATGNAVEASPRESRLLMFNDEVYHVLSNEDHGRPESIERALRESEHHWAVGVRCVAPGLPAGEIASERVFRFDSSKYPTHFHSRVGRRRLSSLVAAAVACGGDRVLGVKKGSELFTRENSSDPFFPRKRPRRNLGEDHCCGRDHRSDLFAPLLGYQR